MSVFSIYKIKKYRIADLYTFAMLLFLILVNLLSFQIIAEFHINVAINLLFGIFALWLININEKIQNDKSKTYRNFTKNFFLLARNLYYGLAILLIYSQFQSIIKAFRKEDFDLILNKWDIAILGMKAADMTSKITFPAITEFLQIAYSTFYFLPFIVGYEVYKKNSKNFDVFARNILFTYFFSYFLYLIMPAIGPRFTVYNFETLNSDLPGLFLSDFLRNAINFGGGIYNHHVNPAEIVNRDCMPSGHTMVTIVNIIFAYKYKVKSRHIILILGISIIIATVYMRYHYFVDVIAGFIFAFISFLLEPKFYRIFKKTFSLN